MKLKKGVDIVEFIKGIKTCKGDVFFESPEDKIDLKSALSQYVFISILGNKKLMEKGGIRCENPEDLRILEAYLE